MILQRNLLESTFLSQISSAVIAEKTNLKLVSEDGQHVMTHQLLLSLHSSFMRSLLEASAHVTVTVCVPVASETLTSLISLLTCGEVRVDGESVYFEEDEISEAATILGIDLQMLRVELCRNKGNQEDDENMKEKEMLKSNLLENICNEEQVKIYEMNFIDKCNEDIESMKKKKVFKANLTLFENKEVGKHRKYTQHTPRERYNRTKYSGAESWLFENYPEFFHLWRQSCDNEKDIESTDYAFQNLEKKHWTTCRVCNAHVPTIKKHYGVRMCESDKQFLKRTFHMRILYPPCAHAQQPGLCPPRSRGWCQSCRLRRCLSTPLTLHLVRVGEKTFTEDEKL